MSVHTRFQNYLHLFWVEGGRGGGWWKGNINTAGADKLKDNSELARGMVKVAGSHIVDRAV